MLSSTYRSENSIGLGKVILVQRGMVTGPLSRRIQDLRPVKLLGWRRGLSGMMWMKSCVVRTYWFKVRDLRWYRFVLIPGMNLSSNKGPGLGPPVSPEDLYS